MFNSARSNQPVTSTKTFQSTNKSSIQASKRSFPDLDFEEDEDDDLNISPLYDIDFSDLELDNEDDFSYDEDEESLDFEDDLDEEE